MQLSREDYLVYLVTDRNLMSADTLEQAVDDACRGGCTLVQVREKDLESHDLLALARSVKQVTDAHGVSLIIDDDVDVATALGAAGVHVGQGDLAAAEVRRRIGPDMILGVSVSTVDEALAAQSDGADYLGVGAMHATSTKRDAPLVSTETLEAIIAAVDIPCVIIGGIDADTIPRFAGMGVAGYAMVSAIIAASDIEAATNRLRCIAWESI